MKRVCTQIARKVDCTQEHHLFISTKHCSMTHGFIQGVLGVDVLYLLINDGLEYNPPYVQSDFKCNPGPAHQNWAIIHGPISYAKGFMVMIPGRLEKTTK